MSLVIQTYDQREANKAERAEILHSVMGIHNTKTLHRLSIMAKTLSVKESKDHQMDLNDFVEYLELPLLFKLADAFKDDPSEYIANGQIKELLEKAINNYAGIESEEAM